MSDVFTKQGFTSGSFYIKKTMNNEYQLISYKSSAGGQDRLHFTGTLEECKEYFYNATKRHFVRHLYIPVEEECFYKIF